MPTPKAWDTMLAIIERAEAMWLRFGIECPDRTTLVMDLDNAHECVPLDLAGLLVAEDRDFAHDMAGIVNNMNRETGKLEGCFMPRYAMKYHGGTPS